MAPVNIPPPLFHPGYAKSSVGWLVGCTIHLTNTIQPCHPLDYNLLYDLQCRFTCFNYSTPFTFAHHQKYCIFQEVKAFLQKIYCQVHNLTFVYPLPSPPSPLPNVSRESTVFFSKRKPLIPWQSDSSEHKFTCHHCINESGYTPPRYGKNCHHRHMLRLGSLNCFDCIATIHKDFRIQWNQTSPPLLWKKKWLLIE